MIHSHTFFIHSLYIHYTFINFEANRVPKTGCSKKYNEILNFKNLLTVTNTECFFNCFYKVREAKVSIKIKLFVRKPGYSFVQSVKRSDLIRIFVSNFDKNEYILMNFSQD